MSRAQLDLTDAELKQLTLALESHLMNREVFFSKEGAKAFNRLVGKVVDVGMTRKDPKSILYPIKEFECEHDWSDGTGTGWNVCRKCGETE